MTYNKETNTITASEGKVLRRKEDKFIYGDKIVLGNTWYINNTKLDVPHIDTIDDFEEIDNPYLN